MGMIFPPQLELMTFSWLLVPQLYVVMLEMEKGIMSTPSH